MTRNTTFRVSVAVTAAILSAVLSACSGGGTSNGPLPQPQSPTNTHQQPSQPGAGVPAVATESIVRDTTPATETYTYKALGNHVMPVYSAAASTSAKSRIPASTVYPLDLASGGGPVAGTLTYHNVYINCSTRGATCWGNPYQFLNDLGHSSMIHVLDQYDGALSLKAGKSYAETRAIYVPNLYFNDLIRYLHHAVYKLGGANAAGLTNEYNIFLPPGVDTCFDQSTQCYSPDNPANFAFCAYHAAVQFSDFGTVLFSVEPFQGVPGCNFGNETNLSGATANVLSHETFETMSDPLPPSGWTGRAGEIGDECAWFSLTNETLNGRNYNIQLEYSNAVHGCSDQAASPPGTPGPTVRVR